MGAVSSGNQYPQNIQVWNIGESEAGTLAAHIEGSHEAPTMPALFALKFGTFFEAKSTGQDKVASGTTRIAGPALIAQLSGDYGNRKYVIGDPVAAGQKGEYWVKIDPSNPPAVRGALYVSYDTGTEGYLVGSGASNKLTVTAGQGIEVREVQTNVARVYVDGAPTYAVS
jgi:hypothetical protein